MSYLDVVDVSVVDQVPLATTFIIVATEPQTGTTVHRLACTPHTLVGGVAQWLAAFVE